jgi:hypothetical protein
MQFIDLLEILRRQVVDVFAGRLQGGQDYGAEIRVTVMLGDGLGAHSGNSSPEGELAITSAQ